MTTKGGSSRDQFSGKIGVIAAAAGSAVGLGNIWKFPYEAGENGGGAFIVLYILFIAMIGFPIMVSEFVIGRKARANAVRSFKILAPHSGWHITGILGVATSFMILSFYGVVAGWTLDYIYLSVTNGLDGQTPEQLAQGFDNFISNPMKPVYWQIAFMALTAWIVIAGIKNGIERVTKVLMPILLLIIVIMGIRSVTLGTNIDATTGELIGRSSDGLRFLFQPDFSKVDAGVVLDALGHAFFSLSLGMGTIITFGSYVRKKNNLSNTALQVTFLDTLIAILSGVAIFPAVFYFNMEPDKGPGLVFTILPRIFDQMAGGHVWNILFFTLLAVAALTSAISLLEVPVAYFSEELKIDRTKATIYTTIAISILGVACSLSNNVLSGFTVLGYNLFGIMEYASSNVLLPLGGLLISLFVAWKCSRSEIYDELSNGGTFQLKNFKTFFFILKFIAPIAIGAIFLYSVGLLKL